MQIERQVAFWLVAAILFFILVSAVSEILLPFVAGMVIAYMLNPLADFLERLGLTRLVASAFIVVLLVVSFILLLVFLVPVVIEQVRQFAVALPGEMERLRGLIETWVRDRYGPGAQSAIDGVNKAFSSMSGNWDSVAGFLAGTIWSQGRALFALGSLFLVTPLVVFYLLVDWNSMLEKVDSWLPRQHAPKLRQLASDINDAVGAFFRGQGMVCLILAVFYAVGLSLIGLNYGALIGAATGLMAFVPYVGWVIGTMTALVLAVLQFWPEVLPVILVLGVFLAGQGVDAGFLSPNIVGSKIGLHPVWLIFSLFAFSYLFGIVGVLVAVPTAAAVVVIVRFALNSYLNSSVYTGVENASKNLPVPPPHA